MRKKVLVIKIGAIGDVVMSLPMLYSLKEKHVHITWVCGQIVAPLLQQTNLIDRLIIVDETKLLAGNFFQKVTSMMKLWRRLGFEWFDQVLTLHADPRYRLLSCFVRAKQRRSFSHKRKFPLPGRSIEDECVRLAFEEHKTFAAFDFAKVFPLSNLPKVQKIAIAPGGARNYLANNDLRRWPIEHYVELAKKLQQAGYQIVLTGAESDRWCVPYFAQLPIEDKIGKTTLLELIELYAQSLLVITHDSGPMHLTKLTTTSCIALFGPTNPQEFKGFGNITALWMGEVLSCSPCYDGKNYAACKQNICLQNLKPQTVYEKAVEILEKRNAEMKGLNEKTFHQVT